MPDISRSRRIVSSSVTRSSRRLVNRRMQNRLHRGQNLQSFSSGSQYKSGKIGESECFDDEE
jgi:hypothetical protein